ncbi:TrkH family potassium uptake protein [Streptosporangium sandarakinum]|uniref:Potassium uptake TrkH family protein n=1 Tax=Streptosporangium sandarakinum TaxID=1260955 RepID=A0A852V7P5_9ACTN|nr:potassium transporter TrkG [Streptosporangium sandarakinum]NYF44489.1 potassium uptake TrkH family protein [Streptosporangium sandarakinum]
MTRSGLARAVLAGFRHPAQVVAAAFAFAIAAGTALLSAPFATADGRPADLLDAFFTATSAVCVTGLATVDTADHWSPMGQVVILALVQAGGLGIMTLATLLAVLITGRLGLRARMLAQAETKTMQLTGLRRLIGQVAAFSLTAEVITAAVLAARFSAGYGEPYGRAAYLGVFHAVSAFNNAGFALWPDSLVRFAADPWICLPIATAVIVGGLGFPVVFELVRSWRRPRTWSVLTRLTVTITVLLLVCGTLTITAAEWSNPATLGALDRDDRLLAGFFTGAMPRSAGFNSLDIAQLHPSSLLITDALMFIGGGSAGTAGGIKVTTLGVLAFVVWTELRGESRVNVGRRRLGEGVQRQALAVALLGLTLVAAATYLLMLFTPHRLELVLFEAISAFATAGLSAGVTAELAPHGQVLIALLMFIGRVGPLTLFSALALRERTRHYELPEERTIVG